MIIRAEKQQFVIFKIDCADRSYILYIWYKVLVSISATNDDY